jgi:transposase
MIMNPELCCCGCCQGDPDLQASHARWRTIFALLNERQARLFAADKALQSGPDGPRLVARVLGLSPRTIQRGIRELRTGGSPVHPDRCRQRGAGRKSAEQADPTLPAALEGLMQEATAGNPMASLLWTSKSLRTLAEELRRLGHSVSHPTVGRLLHQLGYSLRGNVKALEGQQHPDRDQQFHYLYEQARQFVAAQLPVISVDTKKKEKVGEFKNGGRRWRKRDREVNTHDFPSLGLGSAIPYGIYDERYNEGFVNVGISHDTARFAVASIQQWWERVGRQHYPQAKRLLVTADNGGSNGSRLRLWKVSLQQFADSQQVDVTVCHYPTGTSKWNKVEHRLFSHISQTWRGEPLASYLTVVEFINHTKTRTGLRVQAQLDTGDYPTGIEVTDQELEKVCLERHAWHPNWNYTIRHR